MKILLAEDEISLSNALKKILEQHHYIVDVVYDGRSAVEYAECTNYDLIVLDVMLPKLNGFDAVREIRKKTIHSPILILTARTAVSDKVLGLNFGADDYMTKPFDTEELLARVAALTRRKGNVILDKITFKDLSLNINSAILSCGNESVQLRHKEFEVIKILMYNPTMTVTTESLIVNVWGTDSEATDNNVEVYISFLRKKLKYLHSKVSIKKISRLGYRMEENQC